MNSTRAYTGKQFTLAVCIAALLGWAAFAVPATYSYATRPVPVDATLGFVLWAAIVGLPIALGSCWIVAAPLLWRAMAHPLGWRRAAAWGFIVPGAMAMAGVVLARLIGLASYWNPNAYSASWGPPGVPIEIDGILSPYGWWVTAQGSAIFVAIGFVIAMIIRAVIGPGNETAA